MGRIRKGPAHSLCVRSETALLEPSDQTRSLWRSNARVRMLYTHDSRATLSDLAITAAIAKDRMLRWYQLNYAWTRDQRRSANAEAISRTSCGCREASMPANTVRPSDTTGRSRNAAAMIPSGAGDATEGATLCTASECVNDAGALRGARSDATAAAPAALAATTAAAVGAPITGAINPKIAKPAAQTASAAAAATAAAATIARVVRCMPLSSRISRGATGEGQGSRQRRSRWRWS